VSSPDSIKAKNLEAIKEDFGSGTYADEGIKLCLATPEPKLLHLLRSHLVEGIGSAETGKRESVDAALSYAGILELAAMTAAIPWPPSKSLLARFRRVLNRASVRRYYELFYPLLLPTLFRWRLDGQPLVPYGDCEEGLPYFQQFLALSDGLEHPDVEMFLWFLDDGKDWDEDREDWVGLADFFHVLARPRELIRHLSSTHDSSLSCSVRGFGRFLAFAESFDAFLASMAKHELLGSALWHYHAYWFYQLSGQVGGVIAAGIEEFRTYVADQPAGKMPAQRREFIRQTYAMMDRTQLALRRLTSSAYRGPLEAAYFGRTL
jgi:hypothetical protein